MAMLINIVRSPWSNSASCGMRITMITALSITILRGITVLTSIAYSTGGTVEFRWFESTLHAGKVKSYIQYCLALVHRAQTVKFAASKKRCFCAESAKYDMRVHLLRLGCIGDEFKTMRKFLLENMPGCASYKHGHPEKKVA